MNFSLLDTAVDISDQTWFIENLPVLLHILCFQCTGLTPLVLRSDIRSDDFLFSLLRNVDQSELLVHLIEQVA